MKGLPTGTNVPETVQIKHFEEQVAGTNVPEIHLNWFEFVGLAAGTKENWSLQLDFESKMHGQFTQ